MPNRTCNDSVLFCVYCRPLLKYGDILSSHAIQWHLHPKHTHKLTASAVDSDPVHLSPYDRGSFFYFLWVCLPKWSVCVSVRLCQLVHVLPRGTRVSVFLKGFWLRDFNTNCWHVLSSMWMSEYLWFYVCFFSTCIFSDSVFQSVMKGTCTVDDRLMVWLMPLSWGKGIFLRRRDISRQSLHLILFHSLFKLLLHTRHL